MTCDEANTFIEAAAVGDAVPDEVRSHVASCRVCAARLALARRIEHALAHRPVAAVPDGFTAATMTRIRRERWRTEQVIDVGFNIAALFGILLIVGGAAGVLWRAGAIQLSGEMATVLFGASRAFALRAVADVRVIMVSVLLLSTAVGLWWWAEEEDASWGR